MSRQLSSSGVVTLGGRLPARGSFLSWGNEPLHCYLHLLIWVSSAGETLLAGGYLEPEGSEVTRVSLLKWREEW